MYKKKFVLALLFTFSILFSMDQKVDAKELENIQLNTAKASTQVYEYQLNSASISGYQSTNYQYFTVEDYWDAKDVQLNLEYDSSTLVNEHTSSMTLYLNGTPFHSFRPVVGQNQVVLIDIPAELIISGMNTLMIEGNRKTDSNEDMYNVCVVEDYSDNWLTIKDTSIIKLGFDRQPIEESISQFIKLFNGIDTLSSETNAVVLNKNASATELEAAIYSLSGLSKSKGDGDKQIPFLTKSDSEVEQKEFLLLVSKYSDLPADVAQKVSKLEVEDKALLKLIQIGGQHILVVTSNNDELLAKAGRYVANQELISQTTASEKWIDESTDVMTPAVDKSQFIRLTEAGDKLTGPMHNEKSYFVSLPANQTIAEASKIRVDLRYSQNLNFNRSLVTILINDQPIGSKKLSEVMANQDVLELTIPQNLNVNGNFTVTVAFDLEIEGLLCINNQDQTPWAYIDNTSIMQLNTTDLNDLLFNYYPASFLREGGYNSVAVVLPEQTDSADYLSLSNVFNLLGQYAQTNHGEVKVYFNSVDSTLLENKQIIAIGSYKNNQFIRENNERLYFKYDQNGEGFMSNEKMSVESEYGKRIGSLQLIESPVSDGFGLMVITGAQPQYYVQAAQLISAESALWKLYGDSVITDTNSNLSIYRFKEDLPTRSTVSNILERKDVQNFVISAMLTMTVALVSILLLTRKYWRKRRVNDETISKQLSI
ncbi:MAG TPA: cellulose biosynthesis cyclic di-GMP-binding regulatory protein BcsB [Candidatus Paenibacillus intestinavium]|nr:cellulose biosynthesis cyclic di-GMP-binding regulatory protein BcsB [Candidatus Paenibacillus intestinavium]